MGLRLRLLFGAVLSASFLPALPPEVSDVSLRAVSPWQGKVEIAYRLAGDVVPTRPNGRLLQTVTVRDAAGGAPVVLTNNLAETSLFPRTPAFTAGDHRLVWTPADPSAVPACASVEIEIRETTTPQAYCVVDLSGGTQAESHAVTYLDDVPSGGWTDVHRTDYLVLRLVQPGTFTMGDLVHGGKTYPDITLTQPYYIGVFETTRRQWALMGGKLDSASDRDAHPVANVRYTDLRGMWNYYWPEGYEDGFAPEEVEPSSKLHGLRRRTGLQFDLPTEAQWERASRAGTGTDYGNGTNYDGKGDSEPAMDAVGRYTYNRQGGTTAPVGSYAPNAWGIYDMHGNVQELCLDRYAAGLVASPAVDPKGPSEEDFVFEDVHVVRGGHWDSAARYCTSGARDGQDANTSNGMTGFRLACPAPAAYEEVLCRAVSRTADLDLSTDAALAVGAEPVPIDFDPLYAGVDPSQGDCTVRVTLDGETVLVETNGFGRLEGWTAHWYTNVLRQVVLRGGAEVGTPLERTLVSTLGPDSLTLGECVNAPQLAFTAGGTGGWGRDTVTNMDGVVSLRSRDTGDDGCTWLEATVVGEGTVSFWWKVSSEGTKKALYDYMTFSVDGEEIEQFGREVDWTWVSFGVVGEGEHVLRWAYQKDDQDAEGDDCGWIDMVSWSGRVPGPVREETETTEVPVPYAWLDRFPSLMSAAGGDYEAAANAPTGKRDAAGRPMYVWQDFVAGTDPTDPDDVLRAHIEMRDGVPVVTWTPDLNADGSASRVYKVLGRTSLDDAAGWTVPADPSVHRFFKVCVEMP